MFRIGLIGKPLKRSLSPALFGVLSGLLGEKFGYALKEVRPAGLRRALASIKRAGWRGFNVTLPLKERVIPFLDGLDREAAAIGAVNAVLIKGGRLHGFNTDARAFGLALDGARAAVKGKACVIWGAGGAARAAAWTLAARGAARILVLNRSAARARGLCAAFSGGFPRTTFAAGRFCARPPRRASVFVNATPLGMYGRLPKTLKVPRRASAVYCDFAYSREGSPFLAGKPGKKVEGLDLLIYQALASAALWTGRRSTARQFSALKEKTKRSLCSDT